MRVSVVRGGGLAGLVKVTTADTDRLSPEDAGKLEALVRQAGLLDAPARPSPSEAQPDRFTYVVTVEHEGQRREHAVSEQSLSPEVRGLISWLSTVEGRTESVEPPGQDRR